MTTLCETALLPARIQDFMRSLSAPTATSAMLRPAYYVSFPPTEISVGEILGKDTKPLTAAVPDMAVTTGFTADRPTTTREEAIGEIRGWALLAPDWDGDGAAQPALGSIEEAVSFLNALQKNQPVPEPMLHSSGRAGLYWDEGDLYGDLEFAGDGKIVYFVERGGERHKGVAVFDGKKMPLVFSAILRV